MKLVFKTLSLTNAEALVTVLVMKICVVFGKRPKLGTCMFRFDNTGCEAISVLAKSWASDNKWLYPARLKFL